MIRFIVHIAFGIDIHQSGVLEMKFRVYAPDELHAMFIAYALAGETLRVQPRVDVKVQREEIPDPDSDLRNPRRGE